MRRSKTYTTNKKWFLGLLLIFIGVGQSFAQQEPLYTQYMFNTVSVNPGYAGTRNAMNVLLLTRNQWAGLDGAPQTNTFTLHTPVNNYKMGLGVSVIDDSYGPVDHLYFNINYAYRVKLSEKLTLSMGLKGGFYNYHVNLTDLPIDDPDVAFGFNIRKKVQPNAGIGFYLYGDRFYTGFSVPKLIETNISREMASSEFFGEVERHIFFMGGYVFNLNRDLKLKPSFITKAVEGAPLSVDLTTQLLIKDKLWLGASYRFDDAAALLASFQISKQLMLGYSYDMSVSNLNSFNNGSHEIVISYDFDGFMRKKVESPRYF